MQFMLVFLWLLSSRLLYYFQHIIYSTVAINYFNSKLGSCNEDSVKY